MDDILEALSSENMPTSFFGDEDYDYVPSSPDEDDEEGAEELAVNGHVVLASEQEVPTGQSEVAVVFNEVTNANQEEDAVTQAAISNDGPETVDKEVTTVSNEVISAKNGSTLSNQVAAAFNEVANANQEVPNVDRGSTISNDDPTPVTHEVTSAKNESTPSIHEEAIANQEGTTAIHDVPAADDSKASATDWRPPTTEEGIDNNTSATTAVPPNPLDHPVESIIGTGHDGASAKEAAEEQVASKGNETGPQSTGDNNAEQAENDRPQIISIPDEPEIDGDNEKEANREEARD